MRYAHTQKSPLYWVLLGAGVFILALGLAVGQPAGQITSLVAASALVSLAAAFRELTVTDEGDHLKIQFGPLRLFRRRIRYADMKEVRRGRTSVLDGWGIHMSPSGGWTWNLWGRDCVDVYYGRKGKIRIGTDDGDGLAAFLQERIVLGTLGGLQ
jgi:hypothetical protein